MIAISPRADLNKFPLNDRPVPFVPTDTQSLDDLDFEVHRKNFTVKLAKSKREILQVLRLRYEIFHREGLGNKFPLWVDTDRFDKKAHLLIIIDNTIKKVVGTYRLIHSGDSSEFYSAGEFQADPFLSTPSTKVELSRACVHRNYRSGIVVHLLWRGLAEFINRSRADYLFGVSSVKTTNLKQLHELYCYLNKVQAINTKYDLIPQPEYISSEFATWKEKCFDTGRYRNPTPQQMAIPPLLRSYLKAGAKVCFQPALDAKFKCLDFFTILDVESLTNKYVKKYSVTC